MINRVIKGAVLVFISGLFINQVQGAAQTKRKTVSVSVKGTVEEVLQLIERKTDYAIVYSDGVKEELSDTVSVSVKDMPVQDLLEELFKDKNVSYKLKERQIILQPLNRAEQTSSQSAPEPESRIFSGNIIFADDNTPVIGAYVFADGTDIGTISGPDGTYSIEVPPEVEEISFSYLGCDTRHLSVAEPLLFKNRSLLPLLVLIVCYGYYVFNIYIEDPFYQTISNYYPSYKYGCLLISLVGVAIRVYTIGYAPAGTSGRNTAKQIADELNTTGIYSIIRHPLYFGNYLMSLGIVLLPRSITLTVIFTLIFWLYYERIMYAEEDFLRHKFGQDFLNWSARVPTFLPRRITGRATSLPFSWKKVLRQEKMEFGLFF